MIASYFAVFDKKTASYGQLFPAQTPGAAERLFQQSVKDENALVNKYPGDFALYCVGSFDDVSGVFIELHTPPRLVVEASALVE